MTVNGFYFIYAPTAPTDLPLSRTSRTVCALNSVVNARRLRLAIGHSYRTFVRSAVSTKPGALSAGQIWH
jgi:hypothetical protein